MPLRRSPRSHLNRAIRAALGAFVGGALCAVLVSATSAYSGDRGDGGVAVGEVGELAAKPRARKPRGLSIKKVNPKHGSLRVSRTTEIEIRFSQPIEEATVSEATIDFHALLGEPVLFTHRLDATGKRLTLTPDAVLAPAQDYELILKPGILSTAGRTLKKPKRSIFYTSGSQNYNVLRQDQFLDLPSRMVEPRAAHAAVRTSSGAVLLSGGQTDATHFAVTAELFEPVDQRFRAIATLLPGPRAFQPAAAVGIVVYMPGGWDGADALSSTDYYNASLRTVTEGPALIERRDFHAAVALADGRVLVTGGLSYTPGGAIYSDTAEILDSSGAAFRFTGGSPIRRRAGHLATLLTDGRVLITGGISASSAFATSDEIYDPVTETFTEVTTAQYPRQLHSATLLQSGAVLLGDGGSAVLEVFDPRTDRFSEAGGSSFSVRDRSTASLLPDGNVLFVGGSRTVDGQTVLLSTMDLWDARDGTGRVFRVTVPLSVPRAQHTATTLATNQVLIAGGISATGGTNVDTATLFTPDPVPEVSKR